MPTKLSTTIANVVAGATGPTGPAGATGATGPASINIYNRSAAYVNIALNTSGNLPILKYNGTTIYVTAS